VDYLSKFEHFLLTAELGAAVFLAAVKLCQNIIRSTDSRNAFKPRPENLSALMLSAILFLICGNQWLGGGRAILSLGLAMPGSWITRFFVVDCSAWLRRLCEPSLWMFLFVLLASANTAKRSPTGRGYLFTLCVLLVLLSGETLLLFPGVKSELSSSGITGLGSILHGTMTQSVLVLLVLTLLVDVFFKTSAGTSDHLSPDIHAGKLAASMLFGAACLAIGLHVVERRFFAHSKPLVGAHYYSWFPENWAGGYIERVLVPPVKPALGEYNSNDEKVFAQHVSWARQAGIDFFVFDWWPERISVGKNIAANISRPGALADLKFCLMYESLDLKGPWDKDVPDEPGNVLLMTEKRAWMMKKHWEHFAKRYMKHESYLRIDGRPVLFVYATRHLVGPVNEAIREARKHVKEKTGIDLYLVGDEAFFNVISYSGGEKDKFVLLPEFAPEWDRVAAFDALTAYNPYDASRRQYAGQAGAERFLADVERLFGRYRAVAATAGISFIPGVLAGYNDRALRPKENHYVVPRSFGQGKERDFFAESLRRWGFAYLDPTLPMISITSWNEWNEGSQIEPTAVSVASSRDSSPGGDGYTQGEQYQGYGEHYINLLANQLNSLRK
jgi:glycoprotein endo-alpha-1,2-mannosidase